MADVPLYKAVQKILNSVMSFYMTTHKYHWNVVGDDFKEFHAFFNEIYDDAFDSIDMLGEVIRKLGQMNDIKPDVVGSESDLKAMLDDIIKRNNTLIVMYKSAIDIADKKREQGVLNLLADRLDKHQFWAWQLKSTIENWED